MFCFCFILGAGFFTWLDFFKFDFSIFLIILSVLIFFLVLFFRIKKLFFFILMVLSFFLASSRVSYVNRFSDIRTFDFDKKDFLISGQVSEELKVSSSGNQVILDNLYWGKEKLPGRLLVFLSPTEEYFYGDTLSLKCALDQPKISEESHFNYLKYLFSQEVFFLCYYPKNILKSSENHNLWYFIFLAKQNITQRISLLIPEPESSLLSGILYGARQGLPFNLKDNFKKTGLSHIVAVSGYNVQIIAVALFAGGLALGINRRRLFILSLFLILFFVVFSGAEASVVRAGIMAFIALFAHHLGRPASGGRMLLVSAGLMLFYNPYYLWYDPGFYLSFSAATGLIFICPVLKHLAERFFVIDKNLVSKVLWEIFLTTLGAYFITAPIIIFIFGQISLLAIFSNMLVLWTIPLIMLLGFLIILCSFIFTSLAALFSFFDFLLLYYIVFIAEKLGSLPGSAVPMEISRTGLVLFYAIITILTWTYFKKYEKDFIGVVG